MRATLSDLLRSKSFFLLPSVLVMLLGLCLSISVSQVQMSLWINGHYNAFLDAFFYYATYLGDGLTFILLIIVLCFIDRKKALLALTLFVVPALVAQIFKRLVFKDMLRPSMLIDPQNLHLVYHLDLERWHSFPSGHAVVSFSMALFFVLLTKKKHLHFVFFVLALLVAYSRIFLAQHFVRDIIFGMFIALVVGLVSAVAVNKKLNLF